MQEIKRHRFHHCVGKIPWRRKWQPTPVILPEESHGQRSLVAYRPWSCKDSDMPEWLTLLLLPDFSWINSHNMKQKILPVDSIGSIQNPRIPCFMMFPLSHWSSYYTASFPGTAAPNTSMSARWNCPSGGAVSTMTWISCKELPSGRLQEWQPPMSSSIRRSPVFVGVKCAALRT